MVEDLYSILISDRGLIKYRSSVFGQKIILKKDIETCNRTYIIRYEYIYIYIYVRELTNRICTCVKCQRLTNRDRCGCLLVLDIEPRTFLKILNHVLRKHLTQKLQAENMTKESQQFLPMCPRLWMMYISKAASPVVRKAKIN